MRDSIRFFARGGVVLTCAFCLFTTVFSASRSTDDPTVQQFLHQGMDALFNLEYDKAWEDFQNARKLKPETPIGEIFESEFYWWKIFNTTGDFYNLDYIDALKTKSSPFDDDFVNTMEQAFSKSEAYLKSHPGEAEGYFHLGMANALRSRLEAGRDHTLALVKYVRKSREYLDRCLQLDSNYKEAYLGLGAYNFFVEEYGGIYRPLRFLIRLPAGNRALGIQQLQEGMRLNNFVSAESKFFLVSIFLADSQKRYAEAEKLLEEMSEKYPNNPIFRFALANSQKLQGHTELSRENFQKVLVHRNTPQLGDLGSLAKKEVETLGSKASGVKR